MDSKVSKHLAEVQTILQKQYELLIENPFLELGAEPLLLNKFIMDLEHAIIQLQRLGGAYTLDHDVKAANKYTEVFSCIEQYRYFLRELQAQSYGTIENTRQAREQLDTSRKALNTLAQHTVIANDKHQEASQDKPLIIPHASPAISSVQRDQLLETMRTAFNKQELHEICFKLHVEFENLPGETRDAKALSLIEYAERYGRAEELKTIICGLRPHIQLFK